MDRDQIVSIHHCEQCEEGVREWSPAVLLLPEETLPEQDKANEDRKDPN